MLEIEQRDHEAKRQTGPPGVAGQAHALYLFAKEVQIRHGHAETAFAREHLGHPCFYLLPRHTAGQYGQGVAQIDHVINAGAKEIIGGRAGKHDGKTPRNTS